MARGQGLGHRLRVEAQARPRAIAEPRPWSRYDLHLTRIAGHQLRGALGRIRDERLLAAGGTTALVGG